MQALIYEPDFRRLRLLIALSIVSSFAIVFFSGILISCGLSLFQNGIVPGICVYFLSLHYRPQLNRAWQAAGVLVGGTIGALNALVYLITSYIHYEYFGGAQAAAAMSGIPLSLNPSMLSYAFQLASRVVIWILLTILSGASGLVVAIVFARPSMTDPNIRKKSSTKG